MSKNVHSLLRSVVKNRDFSSKNPESLPWNARKNIEKSDENKGPPELSQSCGEFRVNCDVPLLRDTSPQVLSETLVLK